MDYYKIIGNNFGHFPYHLGINSLAETNEAFDCSSRCCAGGLYFTTLEHILGYLNYGDRLCTVRIPDDAFVVRMNDKWKANQIEITDIRPLDILWLIEQGADIHAASDFALQWSVKANRMDLVQYLVDRGADCCAHHDAPISIAAEHGRLEMIQYLMAHGAEITSCAMLMSVKYNHLAVLKYFVEHEGNIHIYNETCLLDSCEYGYIDIVRYLVAQGADIHVYNNAALRRSVLEGHLEIVEFLIIQGANIREAVPTCILTRVDKVFPHIAALLREHLSA